MSKFFVVATPIGNLDDISFRAIEILKSVDLVLAEDTRVSKKLFDRYKINTKLDSYNSFSTERKKNKIIDLLRDKKDIALISDAGTPTISDPGVKIVSDLYKEFGNNPEIEIIPIPGASAVLSALSVSGFPSSEFIFYGFLPHKKGRETIFKEITENKKTSVFYESPHRLTKALDSLEKFCEKDREIFVARELTKMYEEKIRGGVKEVKEFFDKNSKKIRGEFVIVVSGK
ncbi:MAG: 16S rRNA (cytidine(1402)-2'-O)-methyltransferase [Candidatus Pacebacteria bacterium]|nr:16S rRNA (cytidine(1402)-2'-O)-methyltransferase [Candidatus Paceibacterota bacterium]